MKTRSVKLGSYLRFNLLLGLSMVTFTVHAQNPSIALLNYDFSGNPVRQSSQQVCYTNSSSFYPAIEDATEHNGLRECFANGGRAPFNDQEIIGAYTAFIGEQKGNAIQQCAADSFQACEIYNNAVAREIQLNEDKAKTKEFAGFNFGIGIAPTFMSNEIIEDVVIDESGVIRVKKAAKSNVKLMLETHKFIRTFTCGHWYCGKESEMGWGPFMSISLTDEEGADPLSTFAAGIMWGWKNADNLTSWNFGIGPFITEGQTLRDGFFDGMQTTETDVANILKTRDETGWMLMFSATW